MLGWPPAVQLLLLVAFALGAAVWVGGFVALVVVAHVTRSALPPAQRVLVFREIGRVYGPLGGLALGVSFVTAALILKDRAWEAPLGVASALAVALTLAVVAGVMQARRMTDRRVDALRHPDDPGRRDVVRRSSRAAAGLRASIGVLTLALVVSGAALVI